MKVSQSKRSRWLSVGVILMLLALISFSMLPLVTSLIQSGKQASISGISQNQLNLLEREALGYQIALEREPDNQNALRGLLEIRLRQGNLQAALNPLEKLAQLNPEQLDYSLLLAQARQQVNDYEGASQTYRIILAAHPGEIRALKGWVDLLLGQNRPQEAISLVQTALNRISQTNLTPANLSEVGNLTSVQLLLGEIYVQQKRYDEAIALYDQTIETDKQDFRPLIAKALVLQEQGKETQAQPLFQTAISLAPVEYKDLIKKMKREDGE